MQRFGLLDGARVAVQDETLGHVGIVQTVVNELVGQFRGHQVTGVEVALGLQAEFGAFANVVPEQVAGGNLRDAELFFELLGLRALPAPGGPSKTTLT